MMTRTPKTITKPILQLCKELNKTQKPYFVRTKPESHSKTQDCFENVRIKVKEDGGQSRLGWTIWETLKIFIEAEFHMIWISPKNEEIDITPHHPINAQKILFLPDDTLKYQYKQIDNIRRSISDDPLVLQFIKVCEEIFEFVEKVSPGPELKLEGPEEDYHEMLCQKKAEMFLQILQRLNH